MILRLWNAYQLRRLLKDLEPLGTIQRLGVLLDHFPVYPIPKETETQIDTQLGTDIIVLVEHLSRLIEALTYQEEFDKSWFHRNLQTVSLWSYISLSDDIYLSQEASMALLRDTAIEFLNLYLAMREEEPFFMYHRRLLTVTLDELVTVLTTLATYRYTQT